MTREDYLNHQFATLRREIEGQQTRIFWIIIIGLLGMPALGYFLLSSTTYMWLTLPFFVLVLVILYLAEQNHMIRAGRYIREYIEPEVGFSPTWEAWLAQHAELRLVDKHFSSCFVVLFFLYYFLAVVFALDRLVSEALLRPSDPGWYWVAGAAGVYAITTVWGVVTLVHHWRSLIAPKANAKEQKT
ncbi:MAG TPA: hypothetical protein PLP66_07890 [Phycisphaerae bacterium]|nr:hypothetical protein [Phycisphaerae bacterium]HPM23813.1 hypothetical protein [Phycisphaerae bacterium]